MRNFNVNEPTDAKEFFNSTLPNLEKNPPKLPPKKEQVIFTPLSEYLKNQNGTENNKGCILGQKSQEFFPKIENKSASAAANNGGTVVNHPYYNPNAKSILKKLRNYNLRSYHDLKVRKNVTFAENFVQFYDPPPEHFEPKFDEKYFCAELGAILSHGLNPYAISRQDEQVIQSKLDENANCVEIRDSSEDFELEGHYTEGKNKKLEDFTGGDHNFEIFRSKNLSDDGGLNVIMSAGENDRRNDGGGRSEHRPSTPDEKSQKRIILGQNMAGKGTCGTVGIEFRKFNYHCAPDNGISCDETVDCSWCVGGCPIDGHDGHCDSEWGCGCRAGTSCNCRAGAGQGLRINECGLSCGRGPGPVGCGMNCGWGLGPPGTECCSKECPNKCEKKLKRRWCPQDPYDCNSNAFTKPPNPINCWKNEGPSCCPCVNCKRSNWYCKTLKYSNCINCCSESLGQCLWDNATAQEYEDTCCAGDGRNKKRRRYAGCGCKPVFVRHTCNTNCGLGKTCCGGMKDKCCPTDPCINPKGFTCHGHGPLCSCSWLDRGETFKSQIRRCRCGKKGCPRCKCPQGFAEGVVLKGYPNPNLCPKQSCCVSGIRRWSCRNSGCFPKARACKCRGCETRRISGKCRNAGCDIGIEIINQFCEFKPPCLNHRDYPKPWRECMEWRDPCCIKKRKKDCTHLLGRYTVTDERPIQSYYI